MFTLKIAVNVILRRREDRADYKDLKWILTTRGPSNRQHPSRRLSGVALLEYVPFIRETLLERGIFSDIFDNSVKFLSGYSFNEFKHRNLRIRGGLS